MKKFIIVGKRFERLVVVSFSHSKDSNSYWNCHCDCGNDVVVPSYKLNSGHTKSCGCYKRDKLKEQKNKNRFVIRDNVVFGYSSNTDSEFYFDFEFFDLVNKYYWRESKDGYIMSKNKIRLHHIIIGKKDGFVVDHIDRNKKNNLIKNLRLVSFKENVINRKTKNSLPVIGVSEIFMKKGIVYEARIANNYKSIRLGRFKNLKDAIICRLNGEIEYFGRDFSPQKELFDLYGL